MRESACAHARVVECDQRFADGRVHVLRRCLADDCDAWLNHAFKSDPKTGKKVKQKKRKKNDVAPAAVPLRSFRAMTFADEIAARGAVMIKPEIVVTSVLGANTQGFRMRALAYIRAGGAFPQVKLNPTANSTATAPACAAPEPVLPPPRSGRATAGAEAEGALRHVQPEGSARAPRVCSEAVPAGGRTATENKAASAPPPPSGLSALEGDEAGGDEGRVYPETPEEAGFE